LGHQITTFEVKKAGFELSLPTLELGDYILVGLFAVLVLLLIVYFRKRKSGTIHFQTEPISSKFELEE
jgi:hypothetical protein